MAKSIYRVFKENPNAKILVFVGNLHALKDIIWDEYVANQNGVIQ